MADNHNTNDINYSNINMLQIYSPGWAEYAYANYDITIHNPLILIML